MPTPSFPAVGGALGLTLAYNSAAPPSSAGLTGSYYRWDGTGPIPAPTTAPTMARTDPPPSTSSGRARPPRRRWRGRTTSITTGVKKMDFKVAADKLPGPGTYHFHCEVHPAQMMDLHHHVGR